MTTTAPSAVSERTRRSRRSTVLIVVVVLVGAALAVWAEQGSGQGGDLDPRNPGPEGAEATARVLADQGVAVRVARGQGDLLAATVDASTTVVVTNPADLGASTLNRLEEHARDAADLVLVGRGTAVAERYALRPGDPTGRRPSAECDDALVSGLRIDLGDDQSYAGGGESCFGGALLEPDDRTRLLSAGSVLSNDRVARADNAAVALRLLGQHPRLVWYVADPADLTASDGVSIRPLLPRWLVPSLALLGLAVVALVLWAGRRLGPLVAEPLPVVVRAVESTTSRGRLYHRSRDRDHAARILRGASRRRLAHRLALGPDRSTTEIVEAVAAALARPADGVDALLKDHPVRSDTDLATLGRDLLRLEEEVVPR